jgi:hypothetical protein
MIVATDKFAASMSFCARDHRFLLAQPTMFAVAADHAVSEARNSRMLELGRCFFLDA